MTRKPRFLMLFALGCGLAGCAGATYVSPNDPQYARTGAPRAGEPPLPQTDGYKPLNSGGSGGA
jgi:hypothetical protein